MEKFLLLIESMSTSTTIQLVDDLSRQTTLNSLVNTGFALLNCTKSSAVKRVGEEITLSYDVPYSEHCYQKAVEKCPEGYDVVESTSIHAINQ